MESAEYKTHKEDISDHHAISTRIYLNPWHYLIVACWFKKRFLIPGAGGFHHSKSENRLRS
jgi:hypothetical protein